MPKAKTKIVTIEGTSELNNRDLAELITKAIEFMCADSDFTITQRVRVQVAQAAKD